MRTGYLNRLSESRNIHNSFVSKTLSVVGERGRRNVQLSVRPGKVTTKRLAEVAAREKKLLN